MADLVGSPVACSLRWLPESLYNSCVASLVQAFPTYKHKINACLPSDVKFDIYWKLYNTGKLCLLGVELYNLDLFSSFIALSYQRHKLHQCFQSLMDHGLRLSEVLANAYAQKCLDHVLSGKPRHLLNTPRLVKVGFQLGSFLIEAGWFEDGERIIQNCLKICDWESGEIGSFWKLECYMWLMESHIGFCRFEAAKQVFKDSLALCQRLETSSTRPCLTFLFCQYSALFYNISKYDEAAAWALRALQSITQNTCVKLRICACRHATKVLSVKRRFREAGMLIKHAMSLTNYHFNKGRRLPETMSDFGLYLMSNDLIDAAAKVYQTALDYRQDALKGNNVKVAQAHEDLAYVLYVQEYNHGRFKLAREHAERANEILKQILPENHLLIASCRRVKALILEEIAIDSQDKQVEAQLLGEAEDLHISAITLCKRAFGELNLQTAKHYGNLGRLYQSMSRFKEAEEMHLKAIEIKEVLLKPDDYEVALTVGHLASLYNYDLSRYEEAEKLYLRSIAIGTKLFGDTYSGLEYDYRGLLKVYSDTGRQDKADEFTGLLNRWKQLRDESLSRMSPECVMSSIDCYPTDTMVVIRQVLDSLGDLLGELSLPVDLTDWPPSLLTDCDGGSVSRLNIMVFPTATSNDCSTSISTQSGESTVEAVDGFAGGDSAVASSGLLGCAQNEGGFRDQDPEASPGSEDRKSTGSTNCRLKPD